MILVNTEAAPIMDATIPWWSLWAHVVPSRRCWAEIYTFPALRQVGKFVQLSGDVRIQHLSKNTWRQIERSLLTWSTLHFPGRTRGNLFLKLGRLTFLSPEFFSRILEEYSSLFRYWSDCFFTFDVGSK